MIYTVKRIDEDLDFGCEERPKGMPVMAIVQILLERYDYSEISGTFILI